MELLSSVANFQLVDITEMDEFIHTYSEND